MGLLYLAYRNDKELKVGKLLRRQKSKLLVSDSGGRTESIKPSAVVAEFGDHEIPAGDGDELASRIERAAGEMDVQLLWELSLDLGLELDPGKAAEEYFGEATALTAAAAARVLLQDSLHFRSKGDSFIPRSRSEVDELEQRHQRELEKAAFQERAQDFLQQLMGGKTSFGETPEDLLPLVGRIESFMYRNDNPEAEKILAAVAGGRPVREVGLEVLEKLGRLDSNVDPQLLLHGVTAEFSETVKSHAMSLPDFSALRETVGRADFRDERTFSIDDESTEEVDDALSVRFGTDGECEVGIHIADPGVFVAKGDCIDKAAAEKALSLYLATCTAPMLPRRVGCELASLEPGEERPSLSVLVVFDSEGGLRDYRLERGTVKIRHRLSYDQVDSWLNDANKPMDDFPEAELSFLHRLAKQLRQRRIERGALIFPRPEIMVSVRDNEISVKRAEPDSPSRGLVQELMILANNLVAEFCLSREIPVIFRTQPPPAAPVEPPEHYEPVKFERAVRMMRPTRFSTHPGPHSSLALDVYTQISSPLRRFNDLAIHRQVAACLEEQPPPYEVSELIEVLGRAEKVEKANKRIEREVAGRWLLEHLRRDYLNSTLTATVVDPAGRQRLAELDYFLVRGILQGAENCKPGTRLSVRVTDVNPRKKRIVLKA